MKLLILLYCLVLPLTIAAQTQTTDTEEVIRVSTKLVTVPVMVKTKEGAYIPQLTKSDFRVYEDGVEQNISHFEDVDQPFTVTLMLDMSDSTRVKLVDIQNAAVAFLDQLKPHDRAVIVSFDSQVMRLTEVTGERKVLSQAIRGINTGRGTALYDGIDWVINSCLPAVPGRKAIVLLTDGIDTASVRTNFETTIGLANEQYALIYPIQWNTPEDYNSNPSLTDALNNPVYTTPSGEPLRKAFERGTRYLQGLATLSGGRFQFAKSLSELERSFAKIAEELRQQYNVSYYPASRSSASRKRKIKVTVSRPEARLHFRESYTQTK
ncbi:MAG TPA: VWA domain-containing protein [Pyrinomonadaceae bacterium]|nr:VWA domain-containing protein [Pyrinomonadaceae bacterium]